MTSPLGCEWTSRHQTHPHHETSEKPGGDTGREAGDRDVVSPESVQELPWSQLSPGDIGLGLEGARVSPVCAQVVGEQHPEPEIWPLAAEF